MIAASAAALLVTVADRRLMAQAKVRPATESSESSEPDEQADPEAGRRHR